MSEEQEPELVSFASFLESKPPSQSVAVSGLVRNINSNPNAYFFMAKPEIQLYCSEDTCSGIRFFRCVTEDEKEISLDEFDFLYIEYLCSNCQKTSKTYSLAVKADSRSKSSGICYKFGELPVYGPFTSSRLIKLIGPDRDAFLNGRRCESQGLGIGAFVYYRRVVENQKNRILEEVIKVSKKLNVDDDTIAVLEAAIKETQFSRALASVKDAIPQALLIDGHNPMTLLHSALSDGLHDQTDEHCLEIASSVRIVLGEFSDRLVQALKDEKELNNALGRLMAIKAKSKK